MKDNLKSRKIIAIFSSSASIIQQISQILGGFVYRTIFLMILAKEYFGISGLFTNILQMFSLAELGIGSALLYSMHKNYATQDLDVIRGLVQFYKKVYALIALVVMALGLAFYPFIDQVLDISEVPADVNLGRVYFLFLVQSVIAYLFAYRRAILRANQRQYVDSLLNSIILIMGYITRIGVLWIWRNFEIHLLIGIMCDILMEYCFFGWIGRCYPEVFRGNCILPIEEKKEIYRNTVGLLCHKIGTIVVKSTDSVVLSKYISLAAVGIYANYVILVSAISGLVSRAMYALQPTITNFVVSKSATDSKALFFRIVYVNMWITSFTTVCLYLLLNPFIELWLDETFLFDKAVVFLICIQYFLQTSSHAGGVFIASCGLFNRDKIRPLIESAINLTVSVILVKQIGIAGVFIGTCISGLLTYYWRQPYLVLKNTFDGGYGKYWGVTCFWTLLTFSMCILGDIVFLWIPDTGFGFVLKMLTAGLGSNAVILLLTFRSEGFRYLWGIVKGILNKRK